MKRHAGTVAAWAAIAAMALLFWSTAASTSVARVAAMQVVEPYAFAVYHQIVHNLAISGEFVQTIHQGYDDSWTWSGHRAPALFVVAPLYRFDPSAYGLARVQILLVLLGAIPAALIARRAAGHAAGLVLGAALYLLSPPVLALALQDYQDLVLAVPFLTFTAYTLQSRSALLVPLGAAVGLLPREETVPVVVVLALLCIPWRPRAADHPRRDPDLRRWVINVALTLAVVGGYVGWVESAFPSSETQYQTPLLSVLAELGGTEGVLHLDGWPFWGTFYAWMLVPLVVLAAFAPHLLLPAAGLVLFHLAMPNGHAIDRTWSGHSHHLAPAVAVLTVAAAEGGGRILRWLRHPRLGRAGTPLVLLAMLGLVALTASRFSAHALDQNLRVSWTPKNPAWIHPAWALAEQLPDDAIPAVPRDLAPMVSDRRVAYTYDGSLDDKATDEGLTAATHALIDTRQAERSIGWWVRGMPGAKLLGHDGPYQLWTWDADVEEDPRWAEMQGRRIRKEQPYLHPYKRRRDIPGVARFESPDTPADAHIPRIPLPSWWPRPDPIRRPGLAPQPSRGSAPTPPGRAPG